MRLQRLGHVFAPSGAEPWARSHASTPFALSRPDGLIEVFYSSRDSSNRSHIGSLTFSWQNQTLHRVGEPQLVLSPGRPGTFDEHGTSMGSIVRHNGVDHLYFVGWSLRTDVPWQNTIGLAIREPGQPGFRKLEDGPILGVSDTDRYSLSYPWVVAHDQEWTMWYGTNLSWGKSPDDMTHAIRRATSHDGVNWKPDHELSVALAETDEFAIARPSIWTAADGTHRMLFSRRLRSRPGSYDIGLALSRNGIEWRRSDHLLDQGDPTGEWDTEMICYASVLEIGDDLLAFYCGNGYGRTGFGAALVEQSATDIVHDTTR
jgi:hypothetical protein